MTPVCITHCIPTVVSRGPDQVLRLSLLRKSFDCRRQSLIFLPFIFAVYTFNCPPGDLFSLMAGYLRNEILKIILKFVLKFIRNLLICLLCFFNLRDLRTRHYLHDKCLPLVLRTIVGKDSLGQTVWPKCFLRSLRSHCQSPIVVVFVVVLVVEMPVLWF